MFFPHALLHLLFSCFFFFSAHIHSSHSFTHSGLMCVRGWQALHSWIKEGHLVRSEAETAAREEAAKTGGFIFPLNWEVKHRYQSIILSVCNWRAGAKSWCADHWSGSSHWDQSSVLWARAWTRFPRVQFRGCSATPESSSFQGLGWLFWRVCVFCMQECSRAAGPAVVLNFAAPGWTLQPAPQVTA